MISTLEGRKGVLTLGERMVLSFCASVGASTTQTWKVLSSANDNVRVMQKMSVDEPGKPPGVVLSATTSFWMRAAPKRVFDFLRDGNSRSEV